MSRRLGEMRPCLSFAVCECVVDSGSAERGFGDVSYL
jgi:hypothetical protein